AREWSRDSRGVRRGESEYGARDRRNRRRLDFRRRADTLGAVARSRAGFRVAASEIRATLVDLTAVRTNQLALAPFEPRRAAVVARLLGDGRVGLHAWIDHYARLNEWSRVTRRHA